MAAANTAHYHPYTAMRLFRRLTLEVGGEHVWGPTDAERLRQDWTERTPSEKQGRLLPTVSANGSTIIAALGVPATAGTPDNLEFVVPLNWLFGQGGISSWGTARRW